MSDNNQSGNGKDDYEVGYGKPPAHTRFKPGMSGNPKGKQKGSRSFRTTINSALNEKVRVTTPRGPKRMTKLEALVATSLNNALRGDAKAVDQVLRMAREAGMTDEDVEKLDAAAMQQLNAADMLILERHGLPAGRVTGGRSE